MQALLKVVLGFLLCALSGSFSGLFAESLVEGKDYVVLNNTLDVSSNTLCFALNNGIFSA